MNNCKIVKISDFLTSREQRYKPDDTALLGLKRLDKIDFNGNIHLSEKPTKTDMIIVYPGDLVISGINVQKGAIAVYQGKQPITATIHYSSYTFDRNKIDIEYFKRFLKSPEFLKALQEQVKGGIKTEIKPKTFLPIEIKLPDLIEQQKVNQYFDSFEQELIELKSELNNQEKYITQLKQAILQEAISGKLTAEWRKQNPMQKGDPDTDAVALLDKIKAEKQQLITDGKLKKEKPLPPISSDEVPFSLPDGWVWCRLGDIVKSTDAGKSFLCRDGETHNEHWGIIKTSAITSGVFTESENKLYSEYIPEEIKNKIEIGDLIFCRASGSKGLAGLCCIVEFLTLNLLLSDKTIRVNLSDFVLPKLVNLYNKSLSSMKYRISLSTQKSTSMNNITRSEMLEEPFPLPPLAEQKAIVEKVDYLMKQIEELEAQIKHRKQLAEELMQTVLREAFV